MILRHDSIVLRRIHIRRRRGVRLRLRPLAPAPGAQSQSAKQRRPIVRLRHLRELPVQNVAVDDRRDAVARGRASVFVHAAHDADYDCEAEQAAYDSEDYSCRVEFG